MAKKRPQRRHPKSILSIDIGGTKVKILATGETEPRKIPSGRDLTPSAMVERVQKLAGGWTYQAVSIGYPGLVGSGGPVAEPGNLGSGWVGFDFAAASAARCASPTTPPWRFPPVGDRGPAHARRRRQPQDAGHADRRRMAAALENVVCP